MEFDTRFSPQSRYTPFYPLRYVYFRDESLYAMGFPLYSPKDPVLTQFLEKEQIKKEHSLEQTPYTPFVDEKAPLLPDGTLDIAFIQKYGLHIPDKMYLALGDNHAVSADSREFGFVPQENLRGAPDWIFSPPGSRFGHPNQPPYPFFNFPRTLIWILAGLCIATGIYWQKRRNKLPLL
jgi:signal peptidase I